MHDDPKRAGITVCRIDVLSHAQTLTGSQAYVERESETSGDDLVDHVPADIREPETAAVVDISQLLVVETELMKNRSVQIIDMHSIDSSMMTNFIRFTMSHTTSNAPACHPGRKTMRIVITPWFL